MLILTSESGVRVDDEIFVNCQFGYDIRCEAVAEQGAVSLSDQKLIDVRTGFRAAQHASPATTTTASGAPSSPRSRSGSRPSPRGEHTGSTSWDGYAAACVCDAGVKALTEDGEVAVEMIDQPGVLRLTDRPPPRPGRRPPTRSPPPARTRRGAPMTVAVAHQGTNDSDHVLLEAVREAVRRATSLVVIHVRCAVDEDLEAAVARRSRRTPSSESPPRPASPPSRTSCTSPPAPPTTSRRALLDEADAVKASVLVIGARHRSPVGKAFLGSVSQRAHPRGRRPGARRQAPR